MSVEALHRSKTYFEQIVAATPDPFQGLARELLYWVAQPLEWVAGEPDELMRAAQVCQSTCTVVRAMRAEQVGDRSRLRAEWRGDASDAFQSSMELLEEAMEDLAQGLDSTKVVLVDAANAAVAAFNLLLELALEFLLWFLTEVIIAAAAAALSAGASLAASVTRVLARLATTLGRMSKIVARLAQQLAELTLKLEKAAEDLLKYRRTVLQIRAQKKQYSPMKPAGRTREGFDFQIEKAKTLFPAKFVLNQLSPINIPGVGGALLDTGVGLVDVADGTKDRNYAMDGTYSEDLGKYGEVVQDIFDSVVP